MSARTEPAAGAPRGYALFAHCFTRSKDAVAASRISRALTGSGIAVLRFEFTGLGQSDVEKSRAMSRLAMSTSMWT